MTKSLTTPVTLTPPTIDESVHYVARSRASKMIDDLRRALARRDDVEAIENFLQWQYGIDPLLPCRGEAHQNPHVDHCMVCVPRWGWVGKVIKVR